MSVERIKSLVEELNHHSRLYYTEDAPVISDTEYDKKYSELVSLESQFPFAVLKDSPTQRVGDKLDSKLDPIAHITPMLSLNNAFDLDDMEKAFKQMRGAGGLFVELKADGLALNLTYVDGYLSKATTRGDGNQGEDVTHTAKTIKSIPLRLDTDTPPRLIEIRGEAYMPKKAFDAYNEKALATNQEPFKSARSAAAGAIKSLDPLKAAERKLDFQAYSIGHSENFSIETQSALLDKLNDWGFMVSEYSKTCYNLEQCNDVFLDVVENRSSFSLDIDGIVFKTNNLDLAKSLGSTSHHPRSAIAWKLPPEVKPTTLKEVIWQTGRTGQVTPVAVFEPTNLGGSSVTNASLANENKLKMLGLKTGDTILVYKAGDVVPAVLGRVAEKEVKGARPIEFVTHCPSCQEQLTKKENLWFCTNENHCPSMITNRINRAVGKKCLNIISFGSSLAEMLTASNVVYDYADIFLLTSKRDQLLKLDGYGEKSIDKLISNIEKAKNMPFSTFICLLGIPEVGETLSKVLSKKFNSLVELVSATYDDLIAIDDIGSQTANNIINYFNRHQNKVLIQRLFDAGVVIATPEAIAVPPAADYTGKSFVVTGSFSTIERKHLEQHIKNCGGKVGSSPNSKTDAIIVGATGGGGKLAKAEALGIKIINDDDIVKTVGNDLDRLPAILLAS